MLAICFLVFDLQAVVRQMSEFVVHIVKVVALAAGAQVADVVEIEVKVALSEAPDSDIEFPSLIEERPLEIFLDDPVRKRHALLQEAVYLIFIAENFDSLALVFIRWLYKPRVISALLLWHLLLEWMEVLLGQVIKSLVELVRFVGLEFRAHDERSGSSIKYCVPMFNEVDIVFVEILQTSDQPSFGRELPVVL